MIAQPAPGQMPSCLAPVLEAPILGAQDGVAQDGVACIGVTGASIMRLPADAPHPTASGPRMKSSKPPPNRPRNAPPNARSKSPQPADIGETLARAVALHQGGRLAEAKPLYDQVLRHAPRQPDVLHLLGLLTAQAGDVAAGVALIRDAVTADPRQPSFHLNLGRLLEGAGRWAEAAEAYRGAVALAPLEAEPHRLEANARSRAGQTAEAAGVHRRRLALEPGDADAAALLGDALYDLGRLLAAAAWYGRAVTVRPDLTVAAYNRGAALRDAGRAADAVAAFRAVTAAAPQMAQAWAQLIGLCHALGDGPGAEAACRSLLALAPDHAEAATLLGTRLHETGRSGEAGRSFRRALIAAPDTALALSGLALSAAEAGRNEAPLLARRAARLAPESADFAANAGSVQHRLGRREEALVWHRRAVALNPASAVGWTNIGTHRLDAHAYEDALAPLERASRLDDGAVLAWSNLGVALMSVGRHAEAVAAFRAALDRAPGDAMVRSNLLFCLCFMEEADIDAVFAEHRRFEAFAVAEPPPAPIFPAPIVPVTVRDPDRPLRVGYVSPDFQRYPGPGYHFLLPLFERHDRSRFAVFAYYNDRKQDAATERFRLRSDGWRDVAGLSDADLAARIRADGIDVLVDCDGHMSRNRMTLFARRAAPVQVSLPLYPNTTGLSAMDYQFADPRFAPDDADARHSEALIRLPGCALCYRPAEESAMRPPDRPPVETAGVFTFGSFNNLTKLNTPTVALWARVLKAVPDARLMLKWRGLTSGGVARRVLDAFAAHGVGEGRLVLRGTSPDPYEDYRLLDVALDPVFANGGTTTCDALWMGVPVLSITGRAMLSRWGVSMIGALGMDELLTDDADDYVALAVRLATDRAFLARQREGLRARMAASPLMDEGGYTAAIEAGYRAAWRRWCAGLPPRAITVTEGAPR